MYYCIDSLLVRSVARSVVRSFGGPQFWRCGRVFLVCCAGELASRSTDDDFEWFVSRRLVVRSGLPSLLEYDTARPFHLVGIVVVAMSWRGTNVSGLEERPFVRGGNASVCRTALRLEAAARLVDRVLISRRG